jgi:hypothetical protein
MFISFFFDLTGRSRAEAVLTPETYNVTIMADALRQPAPLLQGPVVKEA